VPALHERIAANLRSLIHDGTLAAGDRLPTEQDLMAQYGASRTPVRQALQTLANEGLIDSATSRGTFVREQRPLTLYASRYERERRAVSPVADAFTSELIAQGRVAGQACQFWTISERRSQRPGRSGSPGTYGQRTAYASFMR
jgi:GntR family transcriptional regulator